MSKTKIENSLIFAIIILSVLILAVYFSPKVYERYVREKGSSFKEISNYIIETDDIKEIGLKEPIFYYYDGVKLIGNNLAKTLKWEVILEDDNWNFKLVQNGLFGINKETNKVRFYDLEGDEKWNFKTKYKINYYNEVDSKFVLLLQKENESEIIIVDDKGEAIHREIIENDENLLNIQIDENKMFFIYYGYDDEPYTKLIVKDMENNFDLKYKVKLPKQLIMEVFSEDNIYYICTDKELIKIQNGSSLWRKNIKEEILSICKGKDKYAYIERKNNKLSLILINFSGEIEKEIEINNSFDKIIYDRGRYYIWDRQSILGYNSDGEKEFEYSANNYIKEFWLEEDNAYIWTGERVIKLKFER